MTRHLGLYHLLRNQDIRSAATEGWRNTRGSADGLSATYIICTNPRSGSWLLSEGLAATGVAGNPREWLNPLEETRQRGLWRLAHANDLSGRGYLRLARRKSATQNGVAGVKLHYYQLADLPDRPDFLPALRGLKPAQVMRAVFQGARCIWLTRADKARQAISLHRAFSTNQWWSFASAEVASRPRVEPVFDAEAIARYHRQLEADDARWAVLFGEEGLTPLPVTYEELASDYAGTIARILSWLGLPERPASTIPPPRLRRQSDERSEAWLRRYLESRPPHHEPYALVGVDTLRGRARSAARAVTKEWRLWIARSQNEGMTREAIEAVLVRNGYDRTTAASAAAKPFIPKSEVEGEQSRC